MNATTTEGLHQRIDNTPCPCILWSLTGRDPAEFHEARKKIEAEQAKKVSRENKGTK